MYLIIFKDMYLMNELLNTPISGPHYGLNNKYLNIQIIFFK